MKKTLLTERFQELAGIKPLYELDENASQDLELKSLAKKLIPVIKKNQLSDRFRGVRYETDMNTFNTGESEGGGDGAKIVIEDGILHLGVYYKSLYDDSNSPNSTPESYKQAGKLYNGIMSIVDSNQFDSKSEQKPNNYGYYLMAFRLKNQTTE